MPGYCVLSTEDTTTSQLKYCSKVEVEQVVKKKEKGKGKIWSSRCDGVLWVVAVLLQKQGAEQTVAQDVSINRASDAQFSMISRTKRLLDSVLLVGSLLRTRTVYY